MLPKTIIHLLSGGLDSTVLLYDLMRRGHAVHCLLCDYKQRHAQELTFARGHCGRLGVLFTTLELPQLRGSLLTDGAGSVVVPNRNAVLVSLAVSLAASAGADTVTIGVNRADAEMFPDCRGRFVEAMNAAVVAAGLAIEVWAPYIGRTKKEIVAAGRQLNVPFYETWSCYRGGARPCGKCDACRKRKAALE